MINFSKVSSLALGLALVGGLAGLQAALAQIGR